MKLYILIIPLVIASASRFFNFTKRAKVKVMVAETLEHNRDYCVAYYYWKDLMNITKDSTRITLVLHATAGYINYLAKQIEIWEGPMSIVIFVPTPHETPCMFNKHTLCAKFDKSSLLHFQVLEYFKYLFDTSKISLHFFFQKGDFHKCPHAIMKGIKIPKGNVLEQYVKTISILKVAPEFFQHYPINTARNIARIGKRTRLFLSGDIENYSSLNYESRVSKLAEKEILNNKKTNLVLVHRRFEVLDNVSIPKLKSELYELYKDKKAFVFHRFFYKYGHKIAGLEDWFNTEEILSEASISWTTFYKNKNWEPQFVGDDRVPFHDERFAYRTRSNTHLGHIMCFQNFTFAIMNDVFTVHKGVKRKLNVYESYQLKNSRKLFYRIIYIFNKNLTRFYPSMKYKCRKLTF